MMGQDSVLPDNCTWQYFLIEWILSCFSYGNRNVNT